MVASCFVSQLSLAVGTLAVDLATGGDMRIEGAAQPCCYSVTVVWGVTE